MIKTMHVTFNPIKASANSGFLNVVFASSSDFGMCIDNVCDENSLGDIIF